GSRPAGPGCRPLPRRLPALGLADQQYGDSIPDRIGLAAGRADDPCLLEEEIALARRAGEDRFQLFVDLARTSFLNQTTVWVRPSSSGVDGRHPSSDLARAASSRLRRCSPSLAGPCSPARLTPI